MSTLLFGMVGARSFRACVPQGDIVTLSGFGAEELDPRDLGGGREASHATF